MALLFVSIFLSLFSSSFTDSSHPPYFLYLTVVSDHRIAAAVSYQIQDLLAIQSYMCGYWCDNLVFPSSKIPTCISVLLGLCNLLSSICHENSLPYHLLAAPKGSTAAPDGPALYCSHYFWCVPQKAFSNQKCNESTNQTLLPNIILPICLSVFWASLWRLTVTSDIVKEFVFVERAWHPSCLFVCVCVCHIVCEDVCVLRSFVRFWERNLLSHLSLVVSLTLPSYNKAI